MSRDKALADVLHAAPGTGIWECEDFFPVSVNSENGLDMSVDSPGAKHVMKVSITDDRHDFLQLGLIMRRPTLGFHTIPKLMWRPGLGMIMVIYLPRRRSMTRAKAGGSCGDISWNQTQRPLMCRRDGLHFRFLITIFVRLLLLYSLLLDHETA